MILNRYSNWVLVTMVLAAVPGLLHLPQWVAGFAAFGTGFHYAGRWRTGIRGKIISAFVLGFAAWLIYHGFDSWFSGDAVLSFFVVIVFLKWSESRERRDYLLLIFASVILSAVGALYYDTLLNLVHMVIVVASLVMSLIAIHMDPYHLKPFFVVKKTGKLLLLALPLMLLLFVTFPRIPGPILNLGIAFGLPVKVLIDRGDGQFGAAKTLQPGGISKAGREANNHNVLVAEFKGSVPFKSRLYWRGPVFWEFDGNEWKLPDNWDNRSKLMDNAIRSQKRLDRVLRFKEDPVRYSLRVMPNGGRWIYGLDFPAAPAPEVFISSEFQLLSIRKINDREPKFDMVSYLNYQAGDRLTPEQKKRGLAFPANTNPRLFEFGKKLAAEYPTTDDIVHGALLHLNQSKIQFDPEAVIEPGPDMLDRFFFEEKKGGAEYLAGSFVMLMRAAGVPARLVTGYRGGSIIALTNFVVVKRADAHAWVEVWDGGKGWYRVEPKDIVKPPAKPEKRKKTEVKPGSTVEIKTQKGEPRAFNFKEPPKKSQKPAPKAKNKAEKENFFDLFNISSLFGGLEKWVINFDPDRQVEMLKGAGLESSNWADLLIMAASGVILILCIYLGVAWGISLKKIDPVSRSWKQFCDHLGKKGVGKEGWECPGDYVKRACASLPEIDEAINDIGSRYMDIRYRNNENKESILSFKRQVTRFISMT